MTIITRVGKGSPLTHDELDTNFTDLRDGVALMVPKAKTYGLKVDSEGTPGFGWHDLLGTLQVYGEVGDANIATYRGNMKAIQFAETESGYVDFHMPHDYVMGTDLYIHVHWSTNSSTITGGSTTWGFEMMYAKGHNQAAFPAPTTATILQAASTTQYQHMIAEVEASESGGGAGVLDTDDLEPDGIIQCRIYLDSNDLTDSVTVPDPFVHYADIHYQSTGVPTKQRAPDFWT